MAIAHGSVELVRMLIEIESEAHVTPAFDREHTDGFGEFYGTESWRGTEAEVVY